jgi:hypothetical protein
MGILRSRLPVAAKIALATAGTMAEVPHSSIPPGGSKFGFPEHFRTREFADMRAAYDAHASAVAAVA